MTVCLVYELNMLRSLKALYEYTDRFLAIFSLVDASSRLNRKRLDRERQTETETDRGRKRRRQIYTQIHRHTDRKSQTQTEISNSKTIILRDYSRIILGPFGLDYLPVPAICYKTHA